MHCSNPFPESNPPKGFEVPSDPSPRCRRYFRKLPSGVSDGLLSLFKVYQDRWNHLVTQERSGTPVRVQKGVEAFERKIQKDYVNRRSGASHPLRMRSWHRTVSIPVSRDILAVLKGALGLDLRKVMKPRLLRRGSSVWLSYAQNTVEAIPRPDPFQSDLGICLTEEGMTLMVCTPGDLKGWRHFRAERLTRKTLDQIVQQMRGRLRTVGLDPTYPASMRETHTYLTRKLRNLQAEGAIRFRSPKRVSLGEKYLNVSRWNPDHLPLWQKKLIRGHAEYSQILGLTGRPLLVKEAAGDLVGVDGQQISPLTRANDVIQTVLAKLDLWHGATFLVSRDRQRVQSAFNRWQRITIATMKTERTRDLGSRPSGHIPRSRGTAALQGHSPTSPVPARFAPVAPTFKTKIKRVRLQVP